METAQSASVADDCDSTLQQYLDTLNVSCQGDESEAAILTWTPDANAPNVVYYQVSNLCMIILLTRPCMHHPQHCKSHNQKLWQFMDTFFVSFSPFYKD